MVTLLFLDASNILYSNATQDPWFSANTPSNSTTRTKFKGSNSYLTDGPVGVLGCVTQNFYCNPDHAGDDKCIDGFAMDYSDSNSTSSFVRIWPDARDRSAMRFVLSAVNGANVLEDFYLRPGSPSLLSRSTIAGNMQIAVIPDHRWQDEREYIYKASLAALQAYLVDQARGDSVSRGPYCDESDCRRICRSQVRDKSTAK